MRETYITALINILNCLSDKEIQRVYHLAEYLGIHKKKGGAV